jgi:hypothetical protein
MVNGERSIIIDRRFRGPSRDRGHGGYFAGRVWALASHIRGVKFGPRGIPLGKPLTVRVTADAVTVGASDEVVAESADPNVDLSPRQPAPVAFDAAVRSSERFPGFDRQDDLRQCFACGADRSPSDGLRIFTGPVDGRFVDGHPLLAGAWVPDAAFGDADGRIRPEFVWAALDCPGGWAIPGPVETGTIWAELRQPIGIGQRTVVAGWHFQVPGAGPGSRSRHAGTAIFSEAGDVLAVSRATWVVPRDAAGSMGQAA